MRIRALCSFAGIVCMAKDEVREVSDELASDLLSAGYAEKIGPEKKAAVKKAVKRGDNQ